MTRVLQIVAGSYEHKIFGFDGVLAENDDDMVCEGFTDCCDAIMWSTWRVLTW